MGILRNREFARWLAAAALAGAAASAVCAAFSLWAGLAAACGAAAQLGLFAFFTARRYRSLAALSGTLRRVNSGDYTLRAADSEEGEISILQSEIYKTTLTLRQQSERLRAEKEQLARSMSDISHQLRTPLTSMSVMTDLLCGESLTPERRRDFTQRLRAQLTRLKWLVESLLKLSRLDAGAVEFRPRRVGPDELIGRALEPLRISAELKNVALETESDGVPFRCDPGWTAEALLNLIKNCVEHTPAGGRVTVRAHTNPLYTEIVVSDTGPGFDPEDLPHLFTRFYRGRHAAEGGFGIGLSMARGIVRAQGGTLEIGGAPAGSAPTGNTPAADEPGGGARFVMRLPALPSGSF